MVPISEFESWTTSKETNTKLHLKDMVINMNELFNDYFPSDPTYDPNVPPKRILTILTKLNQSLTILETLETEIPLIDGNDKILSFSAARMYTNILDRLKINLTFGQDPNPFPDRPGETAAITPMRPVFAGLQQLSNYLVDRGISFDPFGALMWIYDSRIEQRNKGLSVTFNTAAHKGLLRIFYMLKSRLNYLPVRGIPSIIKYKLTDPINYHIVEGDVDELVNFVANVTRVVETIEYHVDGVTIEPEIEDMLWNSNKPKRWPYTHGGDFDGYYDDYDDEGSDYSGVDDDEWEY
ncbi:hypothetical protein AA313_de0208112 [Arthrobotrys entomopaga]|nr:hypothetical protein AA313_de0208112 [Arthrobotrys entomopaga]